MTEYKPSPEYVATHRDWEYAENQVQLKLDNLCEAHRQLGELQEAIERRRCELDNAMQTASLSRIKMHDFANAVRKASDVPQ